MSTDRDTTRVVRSWMQQGVTELPDRVLDDVLDQLPATHQRRAGWLARRTPTMNKFVTIGLGAAAVVVVLLIGAQLIGSPSTGLGGQPSEPSVPPASPAPLAVGNFISHGGQIELDATGEGSNLTGTMTYTDEGGAALGGFTVDLACTLTTDSELILIGGPTIDSTNGYVESVPEGSRVAIVLRRGSPVEAVFWFEHPDPPQASCPAFLESILDHPEFASGLESGLEPIEGTIELRP